MPTIGRRRIWTLLFAGVVLFCFYSFRRFDDAASFLSRPGGYGPVSGTGAEAGADAPMQPTKWSKLHIHNPVTDMRKFPKGEPLRLPSVQYEFGPESEADRELRLKRRDAVKASMERCWAAYRKHAWMSDELAPVSGGRKDPFGGWAATLVDSLDTLWIMDMKAEFEEAVAAADTINFGKVATQDINVFETTIRYLGGFLGAYDLSGDKRLLKKAIEVGDMLYAAFDTPNRMPVTRWNAWAAGWGNPQVARDHTLLAELGTFSLEFIRLSILTGDMKWYDAVQRIMDALQEVQMKTRLPGMWPLIVNAQTMDFVSHIDYTLNAMADSLYEYLPKTHAMVGGLLPEYKEMYEASMETAIKHTLYRPMLPDAADILVSSLCMSREENGESVQQIRPEVQHLGCYVGGMLALGGRLVRNDTHIEKGEKIMDGCIWAYEALPAGIMPESFYMLPCQDAEKCPWDEEKWRKATLSKIGEKADMDEAEADEIIAGKRIPKGFTIVQDARYHLRPEAIESVFILHRITGRKDLPGKAWKMWEAIEKHTKTPLANSALIDITESNPRQSDTMESFWIGETLKYFYLMFSEPDLINLDDTKLIRLQFCRRHPGLHFKNVEIMPSNGKTPQIENLKIFSMSYTGLAGLPRNRKEREWKGQPEAKRARQEPVPGPPSPAHPLPLLATLRATLLNGKGFILFKNFPAGLWPTAKTAVAYMGLGTHLGYFLSQNGRGHVLGHVQDVGDDPSQTDSVRIYRTTARQLFHSDEGDVVGLLCVNRAEEGGESDVVSVHRVWNVLQEEAPEVAELLTRPVWYFDRKGEVSSGEEEWIRQPVVYLENGGKGRVYCKWDPYYVRSLQRFVEKGLVPELSKEQVRALEKLEEVCLREALHMVLEVGDIQFLSNAHLLHARTAYKDFAPPAPHSHEKKRGGIQVNNTAPRAPLEAE
ncbi:hypothetical protein N0V88_002122 [Collariella sp. IMI 366227]|nr:hypothetical protein N0V88_002122 [Collariella sp. IMI 366227]